MTAAAAMWEATSSARTETRPIGVLMRCWSRQQAGRRRAPAAGRPWYAISGGVMVSTAAATFRTSVPPRLCDAQGMLHASRYYECFEDAFLHWLDTFVGGYGTLRESGADLVVVASGCEHQQGARLGEVLDIDVRPRAVGRTSLAIAFTIQRQTGEHIATGHTTYVAVSSTGGSVALPECLAALRETQDPA
ncbi:MAG: hypothetical protein GEU98_19895 [Pseudonocardiaceae bacterium]|nr:hypothetical protein [Pseudonocardiaceae bacterium]